jgi:hypothetical protein
MRHAMLAAAVVPALALWALQPALAKPAAPKSAPAAASGDAGAKGDAAPADAAPSGDPALTDMRCIVVAGALLQADDEQMRSVGRASLFYYLGRLEGRGDTANMDARIVDQAAKMTEDDIKTQSKSCGAMFTAAAQALQELNNAFEQHFGPPGGGAAGAGAAPK